jgi:hypothetical protein
MTTTNDARSSGRYERVTDPAATRYLLERFACAAAVAAFERMAGSIRRSGLR